MKLFISHSWRDKTTADRLAADLDGLAEVWLDTRRLAPGDAIQATIDAALERTDEVLLLWSRHASGSQAVRAEMATCRRIGRTMLPCLLDDTPLPEDVASTLGIVFRDGYDAGFGRLNIMLLERFAGTSGMDIGREMAAIRDAEGVQRYLRDYRERVGASGEEAGAREYWIQRVAASMQRVAQRGSELQIRLRKAGDFVQEVYGELEAAGDDAARVRAVLAKVIRREHIAPDLMRQVRGHIEGYLATLPPSDARPAEGQARAAHAPASPGKAGLREDLRHRLAGRVAAAHVAEAVELIAEYIENAAPVLAVLERLAATAGSPAGAEVARQLDAYLREPDDLYPESRHGAWGRLDDAWLVHNAAWRIVEAGLAQAEAFTVDWRRLVAADALVRSALPADLLARLENGMMQLLAVIADEVRAYSPHLDRDRGYRPHMPRRSGDRALDVAIESMRNDLGAISLAGWSAAQEGE